MEGRTIVRPGPGGGFTYVAVDVGFNGGPDNCPARRHTGDHRPRLRDSLQWRAGQLSGQARGSHARSPRTGPASMEGRTIVRPGPDSMGDTQILHQASMEGRTIVRPGPRRPRSKRTRAVGLQWRAGQLSGQAKMLERVSKIAVNASMEGRTIVRPGQEPPAGAGHAQPASMEGRTIVRPGQDFDTRPLPQTSASMEGRTIVRPGANPGPHRLVQIVASMEGRTIVRPGPLRRLQPTAGEAASMEGRTIVRPGPRPSGNIHGGSACFNGGPDNCPARRDSVDNHPAWLWSFNGGPDNCPARHNRQLDR